MSVRGVVMPSNERSLIPMIPEHTHLLFHTSALFQSKHYEKDK